MWSDSLVAINKYLSYLNKTDGNLWYQQVNMNTGTFTGAVYDLYACYFAAELALSGNVPIAVSNQNANWYMWNLYNIEPGNINFINNGISDTSYNLNPENFESNYYLWVYTQNSTYYDRAQEYLDDLIEYCSCANTTSCVGYTGLSQMVTKVRMDSLPSYFFAESMKYLYLTFLNYEDNSPLNFNDYIFNTEAHPMPKTWNNPTQTH
jgi:hypothetical protein